MLLITKPRSLNRSIRLREGIFMYVGSVLGSGILVAPAIAANIAGPASIVAWIALSLVSYPIAYTFAGLASTYPEAGGISAYVKRAFGWKIGTIAGWLFVFSFFVGAPIVAIVAASYVIVSLGLATSLLYPISFVFMFGTILINLTWNRRGSSLYRCGSNFAADACGQFCPVRAERMVCRGRCCCGNFLLLPRI